MKNVLDFEKFESNRIEIYSDSDNKSIWASKDDITLLLDRGYIWQDDENYFFSSEHFPIIKQMLYG